MRAVDEAGNAGPVTQLHLNLDPPAVDPYEVRESAAGPLSTGGTAPVRGLDASTETRATVLRVRKDGGVR